MLFLARFKINGHSMEPQIKNGEQVLVSNLPFLFKNPRVSDIVAFKDSLNKVLIKRIKRISKQGYFVEGDNKNDSLDSRRLGEIQQQQIIGKVILKL
jgi:nickel-type superoxide dismutase maturation protease